MIPTLILVGFVLGRWWRFALTAAAIAWPLTLVTSDVVALDWMSVGLAAGLAVINTLVGVLAHHLIAWVVHRVRRTPATHSSE